MNEKSARALTRKIQQGYKDLEALLTNAIVENVWEPLGYTSFTEWYDAEMSSIHLARGARNVVVITMFAEKSTTQVTDKQIAEMIGVSPSAVKDIKRSWNAGLLRFFPPITTRKPPERLRWTDNFRWMGLHAPIELHQELKEWAQANNKHLIEIHKEALEMYASLYVRHGVEPTAEERKPVANSRRARKRTEENG